MKHCKTLLRLLILLVLGFLVQAVLFSLGMSIAAMIMFLSPFQIIGGTILGSVSVMVSLYLVGKEKKNET